ncbi:transmembrane gamma-carboxyglutamic acid protein 2 [Nematolebias whitei]|uniref:transmembrane gamma-carboxyglutamic acid protein 2 n=1 Tax=Nematolebias whitei TaxID=451745 RepID=UPI00189A98B2|nr:transmembrane gamma-carboxyglutamic acid protein 2 [Nematolebias whitei]
MGQLTVRWSDRFGQFLASMAALWVWMILLSLLQMAHCSVTNRHVPGKLVLLDEQSAVSFLSRSLLANNWDFELVVKDDLQRECYDELCNYEEARECFEDDAATKAFWDQYVKDHEPTASRVDMSGLVAGILAIVVTAIIAIVLGVYCYKNKKKTGTARAPVRMAGDGNPAPETVPLAGVVVPPPPLPSYNEALNHSGQHDAPPPPYSGGAPPEPADPGEND